MVLESEWEAKAEMMTLCRMKRQTFKDEILESLTERNISNLP
jgi:hypothetical protein